jgi:hypothetical protein
VDTPLLAQAGNFGMTKVDQQTQESTARFLDQSPAFHAHLGSSLDDTRGATDDGEVGFKDWFSRPVQIASYKVTPSGTAFSELLSPWTEWMQNPRISNRINNFRNFRGNLKVKFVINGNAFYWGLFMASYFPGAGNFFNAEFNFTDYRMLGDVSKASQRMHVLLDPTTSQGGTMTLPFFYPFDAFDLTLDDTNLLGEIWLTQIVPLKHFTSTQPVEITVYAWCEDAVLSSPTQNNYLQLTA